MNTTEPSQKTPHDSFRITFQIRQKHGDLLAVKVAKQWTNADLGKFLGISQHLIGYMLSLRYVPPIHKWDKEKRDRFQEKLMELTGKTFDDIFPPHIRTKEFLKRKKTAEVSADIPLDHLLPADVDTLLLPAPQYEWAERETVEVALKLLEIRERQIVQMHYLHGHTFDEIGQEFHITRTRAQQIAKKALKKLRSDEACRRVLSPDEIGTQVNRYLKIKGVPSPLDKKR